MNAPFKLRDAAAIRTLFDTSHRFDAGMAGYDGSANPDHDGEGFRVVFVGTGSIPVLQITGPGGIVEIPGADAIRMLSDACMDAERMAKLMEGKAA